MLNRVNRRVNAINPAALVLSRRREVGSDGDETTSKYADQRPQRPGY